MKRLLITAFGLGAMLLLAAPPTTFNRNGGWPPQGQSYKFGGSFEFYYQQMPTAATDLTTKDAHIIGYCVYNSNATTATVTLHTKDASPLPIPGDGVLNASTAFCNNSPFGMYVKGGITVQASATGVYYYFNYSN